MGRRWCCCLEGKLVLERVRERGGGGGRERGGGGERGRGGVVGGDGGERGGGGG